MKKTSKTKSKSNKAKGSKPLEKGTGWTNDMIKKYCEEAGYRIVIDSGPVAAKGGGTGSNPDAKDLWSQGTTYFPTVNGKGIKL